MRVAVMSESRIVRDGLASLIGGLGDRAIVVDAERAQTHPDDVDVVIYDIGAGRRPTRRAPVGRPGRLHTPVVALVYEDVGAGGGRTPLAPDCGTPVISLGVTAGELLEVLERVAPRAAGRRADSSGPPRLAGLTNRELTVVALIGSGLSNKEIADELFVSGNTIKTYIRTAYRKIGVQSRIHAAMWAMEHDLVARPVREHPVADVLVLSVSAEGVHNRGETS